MTPVGSGAIGAFLSIPRPIRSHLWRAVMSNPIWFERFGGTVGMSSIGMFGPGGGWGIPIAPPTLMITIGGIDTKPAIHRRQLAAAGDA